MSKDLNDYLTNNVWVVQGAEAKLLPPTGYGSYHKNALNKVMICNYFSHFGFRTLYVLMWYQIHSDW